MTLIVCLDDGHGMLFNKRRQSRDVRVCERIMQITAGKSLIISEYSAKLFPDSACVVSENVFAEAENSDVVFAECEIPVSVFESVDRLVIYRWNRNYPSDIKFPYEAVMESFRKESVYEFPGNSHKLITEEAYTR